VQKRHVGHPNSFQSPISGPPARNDLHFIKFCCYHRKRLLDSVRCGRVEKAGRDSSTAQADSFAGAKEGRKASACCARNDRDLLCRDDRGWCGGGNDGTGFERGGWVGVDGERKKRGEIPRLRKPTPSRERRREEKRRLAALGMTGMCFAVKAVDGWVLTGSEKKRARVLPPRCRSCRDCRALRACGQRSRISL